MKGVVNRVLLTGANGFIGSHLMRKLINGGYNVGILKRKDSNVWRIKDLINKTTIYDVDLRETQGVSKAVSHFRPDVIFHLATYFAVEYKPQEISLMVDTNVLGTVNLLEASKKSMVKLFVNTSSFFAYKEGENKLRENADLSPLNLYALTKLQAEQACSFYAEKYGLKTLTFRLFTPYGPADHDRRLIPYVIKSLLDGKRLKLTTGRQRWDFVYVGDTIEAYFKLLNIPNLPKKHEVFNIGIGNAVSVREIVSRIKEIIGTESEPDWGTIAHRKNEVWFACADIRKAETFLGWKPKTQIDEGLKHTVEWYKNFLRKETVKNGWKND